MAASDKFEHYLLELIFNNEGSPTLEIGDATGLRGSSTAGSLYVALHTAAPDSPGENPSNQSVNECDYTGYARQAVARSTSGWTVTDSSGTTTVKNAAEISFQQCTGGSNTAIFFSIGTRGEDTSPADSEVLFFGELTASLAISSGITPRFAADALSISLD